MIEVELSMLIQLMILDYLKIFWLMFWLISFAAFDSGCVYFWNDCQKKFEDGVYEDIFIDLYEMFSDNLFENLANDLDYRSWLECDKQHVL
jgi:hypothetical protein